MRIPSTARPRITDAQQVLGSFECQHGDTGCNKMYQCPHCGKPAITFLRKAFMGPGAPVPCQSCEKTVKVTFPDWLKAALPGAAVMIAALFFDSDLAVYGLSLIGLALMIGLHLLWVPLVKE